MKLSFASKRFTACLEEFSKDQPQLAEQAKKAIIAGQIGFETGAVRIETAAAPKQFLQYLHDTFEGLTENQRSSLFLAIHGVSADIDTTCKTTADIATMISSLRLTDAYNAEIHLGGRWYPIRLQAQHHKASREREAYTYISAVTKMVDAKHNHGWGIDESFFVNENGVERTMSGKEVLQELGLRYLQQDLQEFERKNLRAEFKARKAGALIGVEGSVFTRPQAHYGRTLTLTQLGTKEKPKKAVIEPDLETEGTTVSAYGYGDQEKNVTTLPFVRLFSLDLKRYVYADVDDVKEYKFDTQALNNLVLPPEMKGIITTVFNAKAEDLFGDVLQDKHGGMIILANGTAGVGKTLTAEIFAEITKRPLYVMEMAELGIEVEKMEDRLERIFRRVTKWGAILLMDEADVFLSKRGESLERSVIVGIFLRLMDYYRGLLFLTTNRAEVIDPAFKSRITLRLDYPDLTEAARREIWDIMLRVAGITLIDDVDGKPLPSAKGGLDGVPALELNGRQIRNMVRLIKVIHGTTVSNEQIKAVCKFAPK